MKKILIALLIIIVLLVGGAYAYLSLSTGEYDNIQALLAEPPLDSAERYQVNSSNKTVSVLISRQDILRLVSKELNGDILGSINSSISPYGLEAEGVGIKTSGAGIEADLKLKYKNFLPLPLRINAVIDEKEGVITIVPDAISIGKLISFDPTELINRIGSIDIPEFDLKEVSPLLRDIKSVNFGDNEMEIIIPYPMDWLMHGIDTATSTFTMITDFVDLEELDTPVAAMFAAVEGDNTGLIERLEREPHSMVELKMQLLGLNGSFTRSSFFSEDTKDSYSWLMPEITEEKATASGKEIVDQYKAVYNERTGQLADAWQYLIDSYATGTIKASKGAFVYTADNSEVVISELDALKGTEAWLNYDEMRIVLAQNPGDYALRQIPTGNVITALILKTHTDRPVICYKYTDSIFKIRSIKQEEYDTLMNSSKVPVFDIGEYTTQR